MGGLNGGPKGGGEMGGPKWGREPEPEKKEAGWGGDLNGGPPQGLGDVREIG